MTRQTQSGYAMVTAVVAMALLALMALALVDGARGTTAGVAADVAAARLAAAADAGMVIAIDQLSQDDRGMRWSIDGRPHRLRFAGTDLNIVVEDERGKIPLSQITEEQARAMFEILGATGAARDALVDAFLDWIDDDDEPRPEGAEVDYYAPRGIRPRNGALRSVDELALIKGMPPAFVERLRDAASVFQGGRDGFDDRYAQPLALSVMSGGGPDSPAVIQRQRELAGQRPAIELGDGESLVGRPLMLRIDAADGAGGRLTRRVIIELTGQRATPFLVRERG